MIRSESRRLCSIFQRYKSKAIHNFVFAGGRFRTAVFNISKIQIESNSQQQVNIKNDTNGCVQYFKDTNRKQFTTSIFPSCSLLRLCSIFQRYKSKAIHNRHGFFSSFQSAVFNISKIQIESNSQLLNLFLFMMLSCVQYFKDTNRKQFTTTLKTILTRQALCSIFQRYKSKAIHNSIAYGKRPNIAVFIKSKIQIETDEGGSRTPLLINTP